MAKRKKINKYNVKQSDVIIFFKDLFKFSRVRKGLNSPIKTLFKLRTLCTYGSYLRTSILSSSFLQGEIGEEESTPYNSPRCSKCQKDHFHGWHLQLFSYSFSSSPLQKHKISLVRLRPLLIGKKYKLGSILRFYICTFYI